MSLFTFAIVLHVIGAVLGIGAATIHDLQFFRAIGDKDLGIAFKKSAAFYGKIVQTGLSLLVLSGAYFMYSKPVLWQSEKMLTKLGLILVLIINGFVINFILHPKFAKLTGEDWANKSEKLKQIAHKRSIFDAISISAWYTILILGAAGRQSWQAEEIIIGYILLLIVVYAAINLTLKNRLAR